MYANGQAVGVTRSSNYASSERSYFGTDLMGTVRSSTTDSGSAEYYEYDVFGKPYGENVSDYAYTGKPYDPVTGMYNYGYRDYVPQTARFTTIDPIRDGSNWFAYCNNEPVNFLDAWGLSAGDAQNKDIYDMNKSDPSNTKCTQGDINKAINKIAESKWGKTVGKEVVEKLNEMNAKGDIKVKDLYDVNPRSGGNYSTRNKEITIDDDSTDIYLESVLVHEGTHAIQDDKGELNIYDFPDEREAYDTANEYFQSTYRISMNKSDEAIKEEYKDKFDR